MQPNSVNNSDSRIVRPAGTDFIAGDGNSMTPSECCVLCRGPLIRALPDGRGLRTCHRCDHAWFVTNNGPESSTDGDSLGDWDKDYYADNKVFEFHKERSSGFESIVARLNRICPQRGRLLDIGTGVGMMMQAAAKDGWTVEGVEPSARAAEWARQKTGAPVHVGFLEGLKLREEYYDAITMVDVLRTIPNVNSFLDSARRLLRLGGVFLIREGNRRILQRISWCREWLKGNVRGQSSAAIRRGTDCHGFSPASIRFALRQAGCTQCWVEPSPPFLELAPGANRIVPNLKRSVTLASRLLYHASCCRLVISPGMLAFGRVSTG